jgi:hypothetical protein
MVIIPSESLTRWSKELTCKEETLVETSCGLVD